MIKNLLATLVLVTIAVVAPSSFSPVGAGSFWEGDRIDVGPVCHDADVYERVAEAYVRSISDGNVLWAEALNRGACFHVKPAGAIVITLGKRVGSWVIVNGDTLEVWEAVDNGGVVKYTGLYMQDGTHDESEPPRAPDPLLEKTGWEV